MDWKKMLDEAADLRNNGQIEEAVKAYQRIAGEAIKKDQTVVVIEAIHMVGSAYYIDKRYDLAEDYFLEAKGQAEKINNKFKLGGIFRDLGMNAGKKGDLIEAKEYLEWSIYYLKEIGDLGHLGISQVKLGLNYAEQNQLDKSEALILEGISNIQQTPEGFFTSTGYFDLARVQLKMGKKDEAKESAQKALQILDSISNREQYFLRRKELKEFIASL